MGDCSSRPARAAAAVNGSCAGWRRPVDGCGVIARRRGMPGVRVWIEEPSFATPRLPRRVEEEQQMKAQKKETAAKRRERLEKGVLPQKVRAQRSREKRTAKILEFAVHNEVRYGTGTGKVMRPAAAAKPAPPTQQQQQKPSDRDLLLRQMFGRGYLARAGSGSFAKAANAPCDATPTTAATAAVAAKEPASCDPTPPRRHSGPADSAGLSSTESVDVVGVPFEMAC